MRMHKVLAFWNLLSCWAPLPLTESPSLPPAQFPGTGSRLPRLAFPPSEAKTSEKLPRRDRSLPLPRSLSELGTGGT